MAPSDRPRSIEFLARQVIGRAAPEQLTELQVVAHGFFRSDPARDRVVDAVLVGRGGAAPAGVDAVGGALIVQTALVLLQAVATDTASDLIRERLGHGWDRFRRRRAARRQRKAGRGLPAAASVPEISAADARALADLGREIVVRSGGSAATADVFAIAFAAAVCAEAREIGETRDFGETREIGETRQIGET